jgi:putative addiction module component (TIGR02574 family)
MPVVNEENSNAVLPEKILALTTEQIAKFERRLAEHAGDPAAAVAWEEVRARLWSRLR